MDEAGSAARGSYLTTLWLLEQRGWQARTVIDIGAAEGTYFILRHDTRLFAGARHFFVDPMAENEDVYRRVGERFGSGYEICALSCLEGEVQMRIDPNFYNTHIDHLHPSADYEARRRVPVSTLDSLVQRHDLRGPLAIKLDVQGAEMDVLRGGLKALEDAVVVTSEVQVFGERDTLCDLLAFMNGYGWALYDITDLAYYPSDNSFFQCYATFIPKNMDFRKGTPWCLPEQEQSVFEQLRARRTANLQTIERILRS